MAHFEAKIHQIEPPPQAQQWELTVLHQTSLLDFSGVLLNEREGRREDIGEGRKERKWEGREGGVGDNGDGRDRKGK